MENLISRKFQTVVLIVLAAIAVFFSTYKLSESPSFWYDEGWYFQHAANLLTEGVDGLQMSPGNVYHWAITTVGYPLIYPLALWMKVFGISVISGRSLMVLFILGLLASSYFLSRKVFGPRISLATLALLVTFPPLYGNGKSILGEVPGLFFLVLSLLFLQVALTSVSKRNAGLMLSGFFLGLCIVTKPIFILFLPAFALGVFLHWKRGELTIASICRGALFAILPIITWFIVQFGPADTFAQIFGYYANPSAKVSMIKAVGTNIKGMITDLSTLYLIGVMTIWSCGLILRKRVKSKIPVVEITAYAFCLLIILAFLRTEGWYRYLFQAQIISLIFFPNAFMFVLRTVFRQKIKIAKPSVVVALSILAIFGTYQLMFKSWVAEAYQSDKTAYWQEYFSGLSVGKSVFFHNVPEVTPFINHRNYYQYISCAAGIIGEDQLKNIEDGKFDLVITRSVGYDKDAPLFKKYRLKETVYKYAILEKKI